MSFFDAEGSTPLDPADLLGLIPQHVTTQAQLNEWEHANILQAEVWAYGRKHQNLLSISFIRLLHKKMFDKTWRWAGEFRKKQTNIGVSWHHILVQLKLLCDDFEYYLSHKTYDADELAVRFHHRLVLIHAFPNGNGRHARMMANLLVLGLGRKRFTWGLSSKQNTLTSASAVRSAYLTALRKADNGQLDALVAFSRS